MRLYGSIRRILPAFGLAVLLSPAVLAQNSLPTAEPRDVGLDPEVLERMAVRIRSSSEINIHSVLVVKNGKLVFEEYFSGEDEDWGSRLGTVDFDRETLHDLRSVSKSITSALVGIAIAERRVPGVEANAFDLFPAYTDQLSPDKKSLTLHHILSMSAGFDWFEPPDYTNPGNDEIRMINSPDPVAFTLGRSLRNRPGEHFQYNGGLPTLLGYLLEEAYDMRGDEIVRRKLFVPLGIDRFDFRKNASGLLAYASGLRLTPRDMAKIGLLYLNKGRWQGKQIIPEDWVEATFEPYLESSFTPGYGYQWWIMRFESPGESMWVPTALGNGGQRIFVVRPLDMVVVVTAGHYNESEVPLSGGDILIEYVLPAAGMPGMRFVPNSASVE